MKRICRGRRIGAVPLFAAVVWAAMTPPVWGQGATRDLPDYYIPGVALTVTITIDAPAGSGTVAVQDAPPTGWVVSSVTNGGSWDDATEEVKWGLFFEPSIPTTISYDVTPSGQTGGAACFNGTISFAISGDVPIGGKLCIPYPIPTLSGWGIVALTAVLLTAGMLILSRRKTAPIQ